MFHFIYSSLLLQSFPKIFPFNQLPQFRSRNQITYTDTYCVNIKRNKLTCTSSGRPYILVIKLGIIPFGKNSFKCVKIGETSWFPGAGKIKNYFGAAKLFRGILRNYFVNGLFEVLVVDVWPFDEEFQLYILIFDQVVRNVRPCDFETK